MAGLTLTIDSAKAAGALAQSPEILEKHLGRAISRIVGEIARDARRKAPKAFSTLTNSIRPQIIRPLEGVVAPGVDYARIVEEGTGPGGFPPERTLLDWIRKRRIEPRDPDMDQQGLAYVIARSIAQRGTPAQPYLAPALKDNERKAARRVDAAIDAALAEIGGR